MGAKKIIYGEEARQKLLEGVDAVANAISPTLGPAARTVVLEKSWGSPTIINDGVTIAKDIELADPFANMGAKLIQEVASKTQDNAGDGTSTASILAQSLCHNGLALRDEGANPVELKAGFDAAVEAVVSALKEQAVPVEASETIKQVATIAANNDGAIGSLIAEAVDAVGRLVISHSVSILARHATDARRTVVGRAEEADGAVARGAGVGNVEEDAAVVAAAEVPAGSLVHSGAPKWLWYTLVHQKSRIGPGTCLVHSGTPGVPVYSAKL